MWGASIVGFGSYHYRKYESGHEGDACLVGFAARKGDISLYLMGGFPGANRFWRGSGGTSWGRPASTSAGSATWTPRCWRSWWPAPPPA